MLDRTKCIETLKSTLSYLDEKYGVRSMLLFGSLAKGGMAYGCSKNEAMVYEVLTNIENAVSTLLERTEQIRSANDLALSSSGKEKLEAACMVLLAIGESIKILDKLTNKELLPKLL